VGVGPNGLGLWNQFAMIVGFLGAVLNWFVVAPLWRVSKQNSDRMANRYLLACLFIQLDIYVLLFFPLFMTWDQFVDHWVRQNLNASEKNDITGTWYRTGYILVLMLSSGMTGVMLRPFTPSPDQNEGQYRLTPPPVANSADTFGATQSEA
jgi:hypothetical protein